MNKIFISLAISGHDRSIVQAELDKAIDLATDMNMIPVTPFDIVPLAIQASDNQKDWQTAMQICLENLLKIKRIMIVDTSSRINSTGSKTEEAISKLLNYDIYYTDQAVRQINKHIPGKWLNSSPDDRSHSANILNSLIS